MHFGFTSFYFSSSITLFAKSRLRRCSAVRLWWCAGTVLLFFCSACQASPKSETSASDKLTEPDKALVLQRATTAYDQPNGQAIAALQKGDQLILTEEVSPRLYPKTTRKDTLLEPFIRVTLPSKELAWVYANPSDFVLPTQDTLRWQWHNRLRGIFSPSELSLYEQVWNQWENPDQAGVQLLTCQALRTLRNQLQTALMNYPTLPLRQYEDLFPATLAYLGPRGPGWWIDYNQWVDRCANIPGADAELALFKFYQKEIYPPDGIEYHFHRWDFPVNLQEKHSLLGRNIHFDLLLQLEALALKHPYLQEECRQIKNLVLSDISNAGTTYWEDWPAIESELDTILNTSSWRLLSQEDLLTIKYRRQTLAQPTIQALYLGKRNE